MSSRFRPVRDGWAWAALSFAVTTLCVLVLYRESRESVEAEVRADALRFAKFAASVVDPELHVRIDRDDPVGSADYERAIAPLKSLAAADDEIECIYTCILLDGRPHFVLDTTRYGDRDHNGVEDHSRPFDPYPDAGPMLADAWVTRSPRSEPAAYVDRWGEHLTGYAPIFDAGGELIALACVDVDAGLYDARLVGVRNAALASIVVALLFAITIGVGVWRLRRDEASQWLRLERTSAQLAVARDTAEAATRAKSEFLANMSHEIRTPMNGVLGMSELLLCTKLDADQREFAQTVQTSARGLLALLNDVLDFSKLEAGRLQLDAQDFELEDVIWGVAELFAAQAQKKGVELVCTCAADACGTWRGDPLRVRQVLINLVGNAVKFTERGRVELRVRKATPGFVVDVVDTGIGIDGEGRARLFQSFSQVDGSMARRFGGTGLGLAISRRLVEAMHGSIGVESSPGAGSTFRVSLPLDFVRAVEVDADAARLSGSRVLVVATRSASSTALLAEIARFGITTTVVDGADDALAALRDTTTRVDAVLVDVAVSGTDVARFVHALRAQLGAPLPPCCVVSAWPERSELEVPASVAPAARLTYPVRPSRLARALVRALFEPAKRLAEAPSLVRQPTEAPRSGLSVLVVEDNTVNQRVVLRMLERLGARATAVSGGVEALHATAAQTFDLVLMDCQMPGMDGFEASRALREREVHGGRRLPIVALTANALSGDRERCLEAGMDDYLAKPVSMGELSRVLGEVAKRTVSA
ncbi:MAG: response regulator [Planctomycetes bacterium]|nr:response regulator [Planctomycetota bacterium]